MFLRLGYAHPFQKMLLLKSILGALLLGFLTHVAYGGNICLDLIRTQEKHCKIPKNLLVAIAKVESGQYQKKSHDFQPSPWVIQTGGKGYYFKTKAEAVHFLKNLFKKGIRNVDVGCLQVNLKYHGRAFRDENEALDPVKNIAYAAEYLKTLRTQHGSWAKAIARYHSANRTYHNPYRLKIYKMWAHTRRLDYKKLAAERKRKYHARKTEQNLHLAGKTP